MRNHFPAFLSNLSLCYVKITLANGGLPKVVFLSACFLVLFTPETVASAFAVVHIKGNQSNRNCNDKQKLN